MLLAYAFIAIVVHARLAMPALWSDAAFFAAVALPSVLVNVRIFGNHQSQKVVAGALRRLLHHLLFSSRAF